MEPTGKPQRLLIFLNFVITINGTDREATALTYISMPYKGDIEGNFKYDKTLKFK